MAQEPESAQTAEFPVRSIAKGSGPVSWDPAVQLNSPGVDTDKLQSSAASHSSVISDFGNTQYLADNRHAVSSKDSRASTAELVVHLGAGLAGVDHHPELQEADFSGQSEARQGHFVGENSENLYNQELDFGESIRAALKESQTTAKGKFLPLDALGRIVTRERVLQELRNHKVRPFDELDSLTDRIWDIVTSPSSLKLKIKKTTRRKIFAILGLMEKFGEIVAFVDNDLYDSDLPFVLSEGARPGLLHLYRKGKDGNLSPISLFDKWKAHELESFNSYQWQLTAPYFRLSTETKRKVRHYNLEENSIILPFIEDDEVRRGTGRSEGGYGDVWRVKIHPAHHNCCEDSADEDDNPSYAVKRLRHNNYDAFNSEVSNLKRFSEKDHLHLIKLLVTFTWREQFYLLFPWADGNLLDFWRLYREPGHPERDYEMALWFSEQCLGIVQGLEMIHTADRPSTDDLTTTPTHQIHGRHGDLKPENILWFKPWQDTHQSRFGVLKISDFGLTRFHRTRSKSHFESVAVSPTYRPPEYDIAQMVSQSYDIWTLGCVLLEFITWYLRGWDGVEGFSRERTTDDNKEIPEDVFFNFVKIRDINGDMQPGAKAKASVANEFHVLYQDKNCTEFISELLSFIKERMLRMGPKKRAICKEIVEKFKQLHKGCSDDPDYCMKPVQVRPQRSGTELSELEASALTLSPAMYARISRNNLPEHIGPLEDDSEPNGSPDSGSLKLSMVPAAASQSRFTLSIQTTPDVKGKAAERLYTTEKDPTASPKSLEEIFPLPQINGAPVAAASPKNNEIRGSRPQSPSRNLKVHFQQEEQPSPELEGSPKQTIQWGSHPKLPLPPGSSSIPVKPSASFIPRQKPRVESSITEKESLEFFPVTESTSFAVRSINSPTTKDATIADTAVEATNTCALPSHDLKDSSPQIHDRSESNDQEKITPEDSGLRGSTAGNFQAPLDPGQPHVSSNLAPGQSNGTGSHFQEQSEEVQPSSSMQARGLKRFFHRLCCFSDYS